MLEKARRRFRYSLAKTISLYTNGLGAMGSSGIQGQLQEVQYQEQ